MSGTWSAGAWGPSPDGPRAATSLRWSLTPRGTTIIRGYLLTMVWDELADEMLPTVYRIRPAAEGLT